MSDRPPLDLATVWRLVAIAQAKFAAERKAKEESNANQAAEKDGRKDSGQGA